MPEVDPRDIIGEVLGVPPDGELLRESGGFQCPFTQSRCTKRSQRSKQPFPVCSVYRTARSIENLVAVCPKRLLASNFAFDIVEHCWSGAMPAKVEVVHEVKMADVGTVDAVVAEMSEDRNSVLNFVSVELQAVDITGSYSSAYDALASGTPLEKRPVYGFNWANVKKRYITQLVSKGFYHQQWQTRIASVLQDHVFNYFTEKLRFDEISPSRADIVFLVYKYAAAPNGHYNLSLDRVVGTSHSSLMMQALYSQTPPKSDFCRRIVEKLQSGS
ncbi:MAG: hypothetical protein KF886_02060 [Candidatus Hydrogenedentes bacterium]|nr:hypothetical protein [Candidatus Hydrogenedentota bacterium]